MHLLLLRVMTNISSFSFFLLATFLFILMSRSSIVFSLFAFVEFFISAACGTKVRERKRNHILSFCKRPIVLQELRIIGSHSGGGMCSLVTGRNTVSLLHSRF